MATVGAVSNPDHANINHRQGRPQPLARQAAGVRGVAMNPVDHPHGGGEGRTSGGRHPVTPVGQADQGQEDPHQQGDATSSSCARASAQEASKRIDRRGSFSLERPVRRRLPAQEGGEGRVSAAATK